MTENADTETQPVTTVKLSAKQIQATALARKLGLERAIHAVALAKRFEAALSSATYTQDDVTLLIQLAKVSVRAEDLAAVVKLRVAEVLG